MSVAVAWHPIHHSHLVSGGSDGSLHYWHLDSASAVDTVNYAHESQIWAMAFHPLGHLLGTGSNDHTTRWWSRGRPGVSIANDRFHIGREKAKELGLKEEEEDNEDDEFAGGLPGLHGGYNNRYPASHQQSHFGNFNAYVSATSHIPNFAIPGASNGGSEAGEGFAIPGLDASARTPVAPGIPGLAAAQALAATFNQQYGGYGKGEGGNDDRAGGYGGAGRGREGGERRQGRPQGGQYNGGGQANGNLRFRPY